MSLFGSLFAGVSGISAQSRSMGMISDNIANVNTTGYKGAEAEFSTLVSGFDNVNVHSPGGVRPHTRYAIQQQGLIQNSDRPTDVAISGNGFFVVNDEAAGTGGQYYTRAGSFYVDELGNMRTSSGFYLQGWELDANEAIIDVNAPSTVNVRLINGVATSTSSVELGANLDANQAAFTGTYAAGDMAEYNATDGVSGAQPHFSRAARIYDALGRAHDLQFAFLKTPTANTWNVEIYIDPADVDTTTHTDGLIASGSVVFNGDGTLNTTSTTITPLTSGVANGPLGIDWSTASGTVDSTIDLTLGLDGSSNGLTQFRSDSDVAFINQNGAEVGELNGISIDDEGYVIASFTNSERRRLYQLPLATFANASALDPRTGNVFAETRDSGTYNLKFVGVGGAGTLAPSSLESANVELAEEFTKMIVTQRAYSANTRVITTSSEMLDELIQIAR